jgi:putative FmdB family regulatory protein
MPLYEYECEACGVTFEAVQRITDEPLTECVHCKGQVKRLISKSSFQLKGPGWAKDGYQK